MKKILVGLILLIVVVIFGRSLLPGNFMFTFHDETQAARIQEFTYNIQNFQIPPRIAPHMSFGLGYPVFTYYAPFSYWVTALIHMVGFDIADSLKLSFLLACILCFIGMYFFLRVFFKQIPSAFAAFLYAFSPYVAVEIFVRGNLGELWFMALLPLTLYFIHKNATSDTYRTAGITAFLVGCTLTVHNIFSVLFLPIATVFILFFSQKKRNYLTFLLGIISSAYFFLPAVLESHFVNATQVAELTNYKDNFLCLWQIWTTRVWGFGGSLPGCDADGFSFMVGKIAVIFGLLGIALFILQLLHTVRKNNQDLSKQFLEVTLLIFCAVATFMTLYSSAFIWNALPFLAIFQFPWRFLIFTLFGLTFFTAYFFSKNKFSFIQFFIPVAVLYICISQSHYFYKKPLPKKQFNNYYLSESYIKNDVAQKVGEYLPAQAHFLYWRDIPNNSKQLKEVDAQTKNPIYTLDTKNIDVVKNESYLKEVTTDSHTFIINLHYLPYWKIMINNTEVVPQTFDALDRPVIKTNTHSSIKIEYKQTLIENISDYISLLAVLTILILVLDNQFLYKLHTGKGNHDN